MCKVINCNDGEQGNPDYVVCKLNTYINTKSIAKAKKTILQNSIS